MSTGGCLPRGVSACGGGGVIPGGCLLEEEGWADPPSTTKCGQQTGGTHPTGMHSCFYFCSFSVDTFDIPFDIFEDKFVVVVDRWSRFVAEKNPALGSVLAKGLKAYRYQHW